MQSRWSFSGMVACGLVGGLASCKEKEVPPFRFEIVVKGEGAIPLAGIPIMAGERELKRTDAQGMASVESRQADGESITLGIVCPQDAMPVEPVQVRVQRTESRVSSRFERVCRSRLRTVGVIFRTENGPNLPVYYLGREVARTDASGAAHFVMRAEAGQGFELTLRTEDEKLRPQNPPFQVTVPTDDDVIVLNQTFARDKPKPVHYGPRPTGPRRL